MRAPRFPASAFAASCVMLAVSAAAAPVGADAARRAADAFLESPSVEAVLPRRNVISVAARGSLWVAGLSPSGHILVSGSDRTTPVLAFSKDDFSEPEPGTPCRAALDATDAAVAAAEADETRTRHAKWDAAPGAQRSRIRAAASQSGDVEPFVKARYNQCQPYNDFTPMVNPDETGPYRGRSLAGCVSVADAGLLRTTRWPVYPARVDTVTHGFRGSDFSIRFDGSVPFNWDAMDYSHPVYSDSSEDERYQAGRLVMWLNHSARMTYSAGESTSTKANSANGCLSDWYTVGRSVDPLADGTETLVKRAYAAGIPVYVGVGGHAVVSDGWKIEDGEAFVDLVYGYGGSGSWYSLETGPIKYFWVEHYPRAKPQLDPLSRVSGSDVTVSWHFPDCHTNSLAGFLVTATRRDSAALTDWTADFTDSATGEGFPAGVWGTVDDALDAADEKTGFYQFSTPLTVTADSVLSFDERGGVNRDNIIVEICGEDGNWRELFTPSCNWQYYPGSWKANTCSLADYKGQTVQLRLAKKNVLYNGRVNIANFKVTNVIPLEGNAVIEERADAEARHLTFAELSPGADYAFTVSPILAEDALAPIETSDARMTTIEGVHAIPGTMTESTADFTTGETTIVFSDTFQITEDSVLSCDWYADCSQNGVVGFRLTFTLDDGEAVDFYSIYPKSGAISTGAYTETVEADKFPAAFVGKSGTLTATVYPFYESYVEQNPIYASYCDIGTSAVTSLKVTNVHSSGVPMTETLTAKALPELTVQYAADGASPKDLTDGYLANGSIARSRLQVSGDIVELSATPSHVALLTDDMIHVTKDESSGLWLVTFDAPKEAARNRQRMILTLHAKDANGSIVHRDVVLRLTGVGDSAVEDTDDVGILLEPAARPIAVWSGDFADGATRGAVTFNAQGNAIADDGSAITKTDGSNGFDFSIANGNSQSVFAVAGVKSFALTDTMSTLVGVTTSGTAEDAGLGVVCASGVDRYKYRALINSASRQWYTKAVTYPSDGGRHVLAFSATPSGIQTWVDGAGAFSSTDANVPLDGTAVTDLALGGWKSSASFGATGTTFDYIAIFTNATASANDISNWNLANMTGAVSIPAEGGALTALGTGRDLGLNLNGGTVTLEESVYAAALFVQDDTTLDVSAGCTISGSHVLYVAPGKKLTVDVEYDETALKNAVESSGGVYTTRILQGANYGDVVAGRLPDLGAGYKVEFYQANVQGVYLRITDETALYIYNDSSEQAGYIEENGIACVITNATGTIIIPESIQQVQIVAKADTVNLKVSAEKQPAMIFTFASDENGGVAFVGGYSIVDLSGAFRQTTSEDGTVVSIALDPDAIVDGVTVRPEFDTEAETDVMAFSGKTAAREVLLPVKAIPGLWYRVEYADDIAFENAGATVPVSVTATGTKSATLSAPAPDTESHRFYRVRAGASKAALETSD